MKFNSGNFQKKITNKSILESIHNEIEHFSPEVHELLLDFIPIIKMIHCQKNQRKSLYQKLQEQRLMGCFDDAENVSTHCKLLLADPSLPTIRPIG
jgi:hypothetical protein